MKLTEPQRVLLAEICVKSRPVVSGYQPAVRLVALGLAEWVPRNFGNNDLVATDAGRAENGEQP